MLEKEPFSCPRQTSQLLPHAYLEEDESKYRKCGVTQPNPELPALIQNNRIVYFFYVYPLRKYFGHHQSPSRWYQSVEHRIPIGQYPMG